MNVDLSRAHDSFFGPPSEPIEVGKFIEETARIHAATAEDVLTHPSWQELSAENRAAIEAECSGRYDQFFGCRDIQRTYFLFETASL
ncbi:hypothetical protein M404DRAFT_995890, partial [Pisolithus tinctorius Marx 270]